MNSQVLPQKIIGWDTSSLNGVIVAGEWTDQSFRVIETIRPSLQRSSHSERLLWAIDSVLKSCAWKIEDVDGIAVGVGPGSFTGIRIGLVTAKTLAQVLGKPIYPISSLALSARPAARTLHKTGHSIPVLATSNAAKGEHYFLIGKNAESILNCIHPQTHDFTGLWSPDGVEGVGTVHEVAKAFEQSAEHAVEVAVLDGDLKKLLPEAILSRQIPQDLKFEALGQDLMEMAWQLFRRGLFCRFDSVHPRYLRDSDAEVRLKKGIIARAPLSPS